MYRKFPWGVQHYPLYLSHMATCLRYVHIFFNILRPRRNGQHFADDIFKRIFFNENVWILIKISLKFVPKGPIHNIPSLVQIMASRLFSDEPKVADALCVARPQWVIKNSQCHYLPYACKHFGPEKCMKPTVTLMPTLASVVVLK